MMYVCEFCQSEWASPISAAMCCDAVSNSEADDFEADDRTHGRLYGIHRGLD